MARNHPVNWAGGNSPLLDPAIFKLIADTAPIIILLLDRQGIIQHVNPYFEQLTGYRLDEVKGKEWFSTFLPERDRDRIRALFLNAIHDVPTRGNVNPIITRSGEEREIEWCDQLMRDAQGNTLSLLAIGLDVTGRRQAEAELRKTAELLNEAQHIAHVGIWELNLLTSELSWSDEIYRLFEIDKGRFGANYAAFLNAIHPDDRDSVNEAYIRALVSRTPYEITHRLRMSDGRIKWVEERCVTDFDAEGTPLRSRGTVQDITERKQAEASLRQTRQLLDSIVENIPVMVFLKNAEDLRFKLFNRAGEELLGYPRSDLLGKNDHDFFPSDQADFFAAEDRKALAADGVTQIPFEPIRTASGETRYLHTWKIALHDESGNPAHLLGISIDVTERKNTDEQIRNLAFYDVLTKLPNRRLLYDRLYQTMAASNRSGHYCAVMFIDLDNFKPLNDRYGHDMGDLLLMDVALRIANYVRKADTIARFGGDEFVVILSDLGADKEPAVATAGTIANKIKTALAEPYFLSLKQYGNAEQVVVHQCTSSIGVVCFLGNKFSPEQLLKRADIAMYQAKENGRDMIHFYQSMD
ncbi:MAG: hypothetical protein A2V90_06525 [Gammaproteobacteria bacterium RBG_16_57_12]|nr:MAG: hypothetical protein A2V90_06525 [Gammaproteobacteria bacterium RBG_16_57_12]